MSDTKKKVVGSKTTEAIIGTAAAKLATVLIAVNTAVKEIDKLDEKANQSTLKLTSLEEQVEFVHQDLENKKAQAALELKLSYESNKASFVGAYLTEMGLQTVPAVELTEMRDKVANADKRLSDAVAAEVSKATAIEKNKGIQDLKMAALEYEKKEANNIAEINQLKQQVIFMEQQVKMWKDALDSERAAGVERAKASSIGTMNVTSTK